VSGTATPTRSALAAATPVDERAQAVAASNAAVAGQPAGSVSVAALNVASGATYAAGSASGMWTASAYKLLVLETLLVKVQARGLTSAQQQLAEAMIEQSDNEAGYELFLQAGGRSALVATAASFGMAHTVPGRTDPTFTTTSGADYLVLLRNLVRTDGPLTAASRAYVIGLMSDVDSDQRWGVGVVADPGTTFANKNGWLAIDNENGPGEDDDGRWAVTSVGIVTVGGESLLMAVFTQHQSSMATGVALVQSLAKTLAPTVA
jgi:beta-lactamase class A